MTAPDPSPPEHAPAEGGGASAATSAAGLTARAAGVPVAGRGRPVLAFDVAPGPGSIPALVEALRAALAEDRRPDTPAVSVRPADDGTRWAESARRAVAADSVPAEVAVIAATSASTGSPRGVLLDAASLRAAARASRDRLRPLTGDRAVDWWLAMPVTSTAGLMVLVRHAAAGLDPDAEPGNLSAWPGLGGAARFRARAVASEIQATAERAQRAGHALVTSLSPTQLGRLMDDPACLAALRSFDALLIGGAALDAASKERSASEGLRVVTTYGMTETCGGIVYDSVPLDGTELRILPLGADTRPGELAAALAEPVLDTPGRVAIGGTAIARGYLGSADGAATASPATEAPPAFVDGWLLTSDLGVLSRDGSSGTVAFSSLGRVDQRVKVRGALVDLQAVEQAASAVPGVVAACCVAVEDPDIGSALYVFVETARDGAPGPPKPESPGPGGLAEQVRGAIIDRLGRTAAPVGVIPGSLDWLPGGKPDRARLRERAIRLREQEASQ